MLHDTGSPIPAFPTVKKNVAPSLTLTSAQMRPPWRLRIRWTMAFSPPLR